MLDLPLRPRVPIAGVLSADPPSPQFSRLGADHRHDADSDRRFSAPRAVLHPSDEGRAPLFVDDAHAASLGRRPLPAGDGKLDDRRSSHVASLGRPRIGPPAARANGRARSFRPKRFRSRIRRGRAARRSGRQVLPELLRMVISRDERVTPLVERYFTLPDVVEIWKRMIGSGLIGGKSVGMLLARAILKKSDPRWNDLLGAPRFVLHRLERLLLVPGRKRLLVAAAETARSEHVSRRHRGGPAPRAGRQVSLSTSSTSSPRCSTISGSRRSSSVRAACWRTTTATPSRESTKACFAPTRGRTPSGCRNSCRPSRRSTPAP